MPDNFLQPDCSLTELQGSTHAALEHVLSVVPEQKRGGKGSFTLLALTGLLMFGFGASFAYFQHGKSAPVLARQAPEIFDRETLSPRHMEQKVEEREEERTQHAASPELPSQNVLPAPPVPQEGIVSSPSQSSGAVVTPPEEPASSESSSSESAQEESVPVPENEPATLSGSEVPVPPSEEVSSSSASSSEVPAPAGPVPPAEIGVFFTQSSVKNDKYFLDTLDKLKQIGGGALVFNVKGGYVHFAASAPMAKELDLVHPSYDLPEVIRQARERGIRTIGRFVSVKDPNLAQAQPQTQIKNPKSGRSVGAVWVDPGEPTVIRYNEQILTDLVEAGIDEINLDYIRYPTEYAQASIGLTGSEKADHIEAFLQMARRVIDEHGQKTKLGISTYAILGWNFPVNFEPLGQDIARFAPLVDVISPMAYPATFAAGSYYNPAKHPRSRMYYLVYRTLTGYRELLGDQAYKLRPWIQGYGITQKNLKDQIDAVFDSGSCGFTIWNASNEYGIFMKMLSDVKRPEHCSVQGN